MVQWFRREETPEPPLLDAGYLTRLGKHIGMAELRELMADGLIELTDRLDALERHAVRGDTEEVATLCHEIAGAAGHLGLSRMSQAAVDGVRRCRGGTQEPMLDVIADVLAARTASLATASDFCIASVDDLDDTELSTECRESEAVADNETTTTVRQE